MSLVSAEEARKIADEEYSANVKKEMHRIEESIKFAYNHGKYSVFLDDIKYGENIKALKKLKYKVRPRFCFLDLTGFVVSWS